MKTSWFVPAVLFTIFLLLLAGCTDILPDRGAAVPTPGPVQTLPQGKHVTIEVDQKDPIYATVTVSFAGGEGQIAVTGIELRFTTADGVVTTKPLQPVKGDEVIFQGTKETDRLEGWVTLNTGVTYKTLDMLIPYRTRG
ncbi:MAG: hypothetical protein GKC05_04170 [Methanomicrobiales archaeon]|nr:hypothetical protein [Methanomicrobiales archaeon]